MPTTTQSPRVDERLVRELRDRGVKKATPRAVRALRQRGCLPPLVHRSRGHARGVEREFTPEVVAQAEEALTLLGRGVSWDALPLVLFMRGRPVRETALRRAYRRLFNGTQAYYLSKGKTPEEKAELAAVALLDRMRRQRGVLAEWGRFFGERNPKKRDHFVHRALVAFFMLVQGRPVDFEHLRDLAVGTGALARVPSVPPAPPGATVALDALSFDNLTRVAAATSFAELAGTRDAVLGGLAFAQHQLGIDLRAFLDTLTPGDGEIILALIVVAWLAAFQLPAGIDFSALDWPMGTEATV